MSSVAANRPVIVVGGGHHARVVIAILQRLRLEVAGYTDPVPSANKILGVSHLGGDEEILKRDSEQVVLANGLGNVDMTDRRMVVYDELKNKGYKFTEVIHPQTKTAKNVVLKEGCQVMVGAVLQIDATIGENAIVNTGACIDHGCNIGNHVHVAPGAILCGEVTVGPKTHVGANATVIENVDIGANCMIGAGAVVIRDVAAHSRVAGVPAEEI